MGAHIEPPPPDRYCDLVMKGGITSGVVYPRAIARLSEKYRLKSIGGTSAGAIAAALSAAAEYRRHSDNGSNEGFELLRNLPEELQQELPRSRKRKLLSLFQPQPGGPSRLFRVLVTALNSGGTYRRIIRIGAGLMWAYRWPVFGAFAVAFGAGYFLGALVGALVLVICLPLFIAAALYWDLTRGVVKNGFGLCKGNSEHRRNEALMPWLHKKIQLTAKLPGDEPLTFGHLWRAGDAAPPAWLKVDPKKWRVIDLQMFSTNLTHGRPYVFPLPSSSESEQFPDLDRLYYKESDLKGYVPDDILEWMDKKTKPYKQERPIDPPASAASGIRRLPEPADFPVLLAARMSLSFPLLFSAVPLYAVDHDAPKGKPREFRKCWFSDGGISSNFPMHLFDGLVPIWPTFGVNLEPVQAEMQPFVELPSRYDQGYGERLNMFCKETDKPASRFGEFLFAIVGAMQNWNDNMITRMPGVRDRVARVRLEENEGGMNLDMEKGRIQSIAGKGEAAALKLIERFAKPANGNGQAAGWDEHRLVRLNVLLKMIEARAPGVLSALGTCDHATCFEDLINAAAKGPVPAAGYEALWTDAEKAALENVLKALADLGKVAIPANLNRFVPIPNPELRVRPPL